MYIMLYKIGEENFRFLGTNGFHAKAKTERFTAATAINTVMLKVFTQNSIKQIKLIFIEQRACTVFLFKQRSVSVEELSADSCQAKICCC